MRASEHLSLAYRCHRRELTVPSVLTFRSVRVAATSRGMSSKRWQQCLECRDPQDALYQTYSPEEKGGGSLL